MGDSGSSVGDFGVIISPPRGFVGFGIYRVRLLMMKQSSDSPNQMRTPLLQTFPKIILLCCSPEFGVPSLCIAPKNEDHHT